MKINEDGLLNLKDLIIDGDTSEIDEMIEYEEILFEISDSLKRYRKERNLTQRQLSKLLNFDQVMISKMESGNYNPTFKQLHKISRKLTNSASLFIGVLQNIIDNFNKMYKVSYKTTIKEKKYAKSKNNNVIFINDFASCEMKGGKYGTEECTSSIPDVG